MYRRDLPEFTSRLGVVPAILAILWLPMHIIGLPWILVRFFGIRDDVQINFITYAVGAVFLLIVGFLFLRRDFDALLDHPGRVFLQVLGCYAAMLLMNIAVSGVLMLLVDEAENPNNAAVMEMVSVQSNTMSAIAIFLAPFVEEMIFRAVTATCQLAKHQTTWCRGWKKEKTEIDPRKSGVADMIAASWRAAPE